jgi:hypothetical protein
MCEKKGRNLINALPWIYLNNDIPLTAAVSVRTKWKELRFSSEASAKYTSTVVIY